MADDDLNKNIKEGEGLFKGLENSLKGFLGKVGDAFKANFDLETTAKIITEVDNAAVSIAKSFGQGRENVLGISQAMADAAVSVAKLGGGFGDIAGIQADVSKTLGRNVVVVSEAYDKLYATSKVTQQDIGTLVTSFKDVGISAYQVTKNMETVMDVVRATGANAKGVTDAVVSNLDYMNKINFQGGVKGLAEMAAQAVKLRIDMGATLGLSESLLNPEKAIDLAAAMQRLGAANSDLLDPLRLMDLGQNDPAELQNQIAKMSEQFVQLNEKGQFEIMPGAKRQLMEISKELYGNTETLGKMALGAAETADKMNKIKFPEGAFDEKTKNLIASMAEMGEGGKYELSIGGETLGIDEAISKLQSDPKLLKALEDSAQPKTMEDLAEQQLTVSQQMAADIKSLVKMPYAIAGTRVAKQAIEAPRLVTRGIRDVASGPSLDVKEMRTSLGGGIEDTLKSINALLTGDQSVTEVMGKFGEMAKKAEEYSKTIFEEGQDRLKKATDELVNSENIFVQLIKNVAKKTGEAFVESENLTNIQAKDFLMTPQGKIELYDEDYFAAFTDKTGSVRNNMMGGGNSGTMDMGKGQVDVGGTITIKVEAPDVNTKHLEEVLNNSTAIQEQIVKGISRNMFNRDMPTANPTQLMEKMRSRSY